MNKEAHTKTSAKSQTRTLHANRDAVFEETMEDVRHDLPRATRPFSRFLHRPGIERISDFVGNTIARPHAILAGGIAAFAGVLGLYFYAKYAGFTFQGSETITAFAIGWVVGMMFDFFRTMITGKR